MTRKRHRIRKQTYNIQHHQHSFNTINKNHPRIKRTLRISKNKAHHPHLPNIMKKPRTTQRNRHVLITKHIKKKKNKQPSKKPYRNIKQNIVTKLSKQRPQPKKITTLLPKKEEHILQFQMKSSCHLTTQK